MFSKHVLKKKKIMGKRGFSDQLDLVNREISMMKELSHKNVVWCLNWIKAYQIRLIEVIDDEVADQLCLVMEYASKGCAMNMERENNIPVSENLCRSYLKDLVAALVYLHSIGIAHRDIKCDNLLVFDDGVVKLGDFGVSARFESENDLTLETVGASAFMAPEMCVPSGPPFSMRKAGKIV